MDTQTFERWLVSEMQEILPRTTSTPPFTVWCDPDRQWLKKNLEVEDCLTIEEVLDGETLKKATRARGLIAVYGKEFDRHDGEVAAQADASHQALFWR
ncbi:MAG: hypothetical protein ACQESR_08010 [Planctomycetota bacterium]